MRISFIGSGRVASHLALVLSQHHDIVQIYSRSLAHATSLAKQVHAQAIDDISLLQKNVDLVIVAVSDGAIAPLSAATAPFLEDVLCVHTSGSTDIAVLAAHHARCGVFYPLQTFSIESPVDWQQTPLLVEASQASDLKLLLALAHSLSSRVYAYDSAQRLSLHLAAVFACNFSNYCYDLAKQVVETEQVDFNLLLPLIQATAQKITEHDPHTMQTGPARRHDTDILSTHHRMLLDLKRPDMAQVYQLLSEHIQQRHPQT